jgi:hypothetical protein
MATTLPRPLSIWEAADRRSAIWLQVTVALLVLNGVLAGTLFKLMTKPPLVYRVSNDGIPQAVVLNTAVYGEPQTNELRAFVRIAVTPKLLRLDSYAIVNDLLDVTKLMSAECYKAFQPEIENLISGVEGVRRRAYIDESKLEIEVSKDTYPWRATVKGLRQIVVPKGYPPVPPQPFQVSFDLVQTQRSETNPWGLLVHAFQTQGTLLQVATRKPGE